MTRLSLVLVLGVTACGTIGGEIGGPTADGGDDVASPSDAAQEGLDAGACTSEAVAVPAQERVPNGNAVLPPKWAFGVLWGSYYDQVGST